MERCVGPQTEQDRSSALSSILQRTENTELNKRNGESCLDIPLLRRFQRSISSPPLESSLQKNGGVVSTSEDSGSQENPKEQPQENKLNVTLIPTGPTLCDRTILGDLAESFSMDERHLLHVGQDEHRNNGFASSGLNTSCYLRKSPERESPGGCSLSPGDNGEEILKDDHHIQAVTCRAKAHEVTRESDCIQGEDDTQFSDLQLQLSKAAVTDASEMGENAISHSQLQICGAHNVSELTLESAGQARESTELIPCVAEHSEGSSLAGDSGSIRNALLRNVSSEVLENDFCFAKGEPAAVKMKANSKRETADHTTQTPTPSVFSQEPAEGDNDGSVDVTDPEFRRVFDQEAEEKCLNLSKTFSRDIPPSVSICEQHPSLPPCSDGWPSEKVASPHQRRQLSEQPRRCQGENGISHSCTNLHPLCISVNKKLEKAGPSSCRQSECRLSYSPAASHIVESYSFQESVDTVGHELKKQRQFYCVSAGLVPEETQETEQSLEDKDEMDWLEEEMVSFEEEIEGRQEEPMKSQETLRYIDETIPIEFNDYFSDIREPEKPNLDIKLKVVEGRGRKVVEGENKREYLPNHQTGADFAMMDVTSEGKAENEEHFMEEKMRSDKLDNSVTQEKSENDIQQDNECISDVTMPIGSCSDRTKRQKSHLCLDENQDQVFANFAGNPNNTDHLALTLPPTNDAVVPSPFYFKESKTAIDGFTAPTCPDRFSQLPAAFTIYSCALDGFDTFETIQLSPDDDSDTAVINKNNTPVFTSSLRQLLQTPQLPCEPCRPKAEDEETKEEEMENAVCQKENSFKSLTCNSASGEPLNSMAPTDALRCPEMPPSFESDFKSSNQTESSMKPEPSADHHTSTSYISQAHEFEMKKEFDEVLKELNMFFDISRADFSPPPSQQCYDVFETNKGTTMKCNENPCSPDNIHHGDASPENPIKPDSLELSEEETTCNPSNILSESEQEVPLSANLCQEASREPAGTQRGCSQLERRESTWSPSFTCLPILEQLSHRVPVQPRRLEPLKTCKRPIRVGLSKRAKTKHLHRCHPYK